MIWHRDGEKIVLEGEADQIPDQEPGNIIFKLVESEHDIFRRAGADLSADMEITLAEALCGFSRVVLKHLDGRGLHIDHRKAKGRILRPGQVIKVANEGMPLKKSDLRGDLYLTVQVKFPEDEWLRNGDTLSKLQTLLPGPAVPIVTETVDEVNFETAKSEDFGKDEQNREEWEDEEDIDDEDSVHQCAQQ